jgi:hypothetical protein
MLIQGPKINRNFRNSPIVPHQATGQTNHGNPYAMVQVWFEWPPSIHCYHRFDTQGGGI